MTSSNGRTFSALQSICAGNSPVTGVFPAQRPVTRSFDVFFDKRLNKQWWGWWFETPSRPLWRHCNDVKPYMRLLRTLHSSLWIRIRDHRNKNVAGCKMITSVILIVTRNLTTTAEFVLVLWLLSVLLISSSGCCSQYRYCQYHRHNWYCSFVHSRLTITILLFFCRTIFIIIKIVIVISTVIKTITMLSSW